MIGDWAMVRGNGNIVCGLTLTNNDAGNDNFQVFLKPKCDPAVAAFAPKQWRLERGQIMLMSDRGETWRFEADDNAQWRLVPRQRRSADHAAAVGPGQYSGTGLIFSLAVSIRPRQDRRSR